MMNMGPAVTQHKDTVSSIIDLDRYLDLILLNKWKIIAFSLSVAAITALATQLVDPIYRSTATILIQNNDPKVISIEKLYSAEKEDNYLSTELQILNSRAIAEQVVRKLALTTEPELNPNENLENSGQSSFFSENIAALRSLLPFTQKKEALPPAETEKVIVKTVRANLEIEGIPNTNIARIHYMAKNPELAARIANSIADIYITNYLDAKLEEAKRATSWLTGNLRDLNLSLKQSEMKLQAYRDSEQLADVNGVQTIYAQEINQLTQRYIKSKEASSQAESLYNQITSLGTSATAEELMTIPGILQNPLVQNLKKTLLNAELKVAELSNRYGKLHPKLITAKSEAEEAETELHAQVFQIANGVKSTYLGAKETEKMLQTQLQASKSNIQNLNSKEFKLSELQREVETNRHLYEMFLSRSKEADQTKTFQAANARIIDKAIPSGSPVKPNKLFNIMIAFTLSLFTATLYTCYRQDFKNYIRYPDDIEAKLNTTNLGFLPAVPANKKDMPYEGFLQKNSSYFSEAIRTIRTSLMISNMNNQKKVILVTSSVPYEGKSTIAINLSEAFGQLGKTLLIDADLRLPSIADALEIPRSKAGLVNLLLGESNFEESIHHLSENLIDVITSGTRIENPLELLSSRSLTSLIDEAKNHYDYIILDTAPVNAVSDAMILSQHSDFLIYVVKANSTPARIVSRGIKNLEDYGSRISGVILNQLDLRIAKDSLGYYGSYYKPESKKNSAYG